MVPFNYSHKFNIKEIDEHHIKVKLPYIKRNLNHLKGLHACAMATLVEVSSGFLLISRLNPKRYRLILSRLEIDYYYQGKSDAFVEFIIEKKWWNDQVLNPIQTEGIINVPCEVQVRDKENNHLATGIAHWQIKDWEKVKTK